MTEKIRIGVSSCLIGEKVRWNGDHKQDRYVREILSRYFEYIPVCPEVEVGMGVPRETVALYGDPEKPSMISKKTQTDWTKPMEKYIKSRINTLSADDLCGYIFKSKSPSCGMGRVPLYSEFGSHKVKHGPGMFANAFINSFPLVPTEEEGRLNDPRIRENFIVRVFSFKRFNLLLNEKFSLGQWVKFHTQHKFLLLAHSRKHYDELGELVAHSKTIKPSELKKKYGELFMEALTSKSTPKKNTDVLLHMMGFLKKLLTKIEKEDILSTIEDYRSEILPLIVPVTLIRHQVKKHNIEYLHDQLYLNPHPKELMLLNHV
jgi:uncharacterized protein YbgA (DUF1722 family)/uncharacterized protein YbbK (DUF523 family)|tara:strand:- start:52 stop:1005 length:954 start_codon:yes stop_codon:yes gene_type:complete